jgi:hypothetical protein
MGEHTTHTKIDRMIVQAAHLPNTSFFAAALTIAQTAVDAAAICVSRKNRVKAYQADLSTPRARRDQRHT